MSSLLNNLETMQDVLAAITNGNNMKGKMFNITKEIMEYGESLDLQPVGTGGGCDFMVRTNEGKAPMIFTDNESMDGRFDLVLSSKEDIGSSPDTLDEPSTVVCYMEDPEWQDHYCIDFDDAREAIQFMSKCKDRDDFFQPEEFNLYK